MKDKSCKHKSIKILVCTHKESQYPKDDIYIPIHCGKVYSDIDLNILRDDTGKNISHKNKNYCELTALYWAWKNLKDYDYIGLVHYRRYLSKYKSRFFSIETIRKKNINSIEKEALNAELIQNILLEHDIILPQPKVFPSSLKDSYCKYHIPRDYNILKKAIQKTCPEYLPSFNYVMEQNNKLSCYNMFITKRTIIENYCQWLFNLLEEVEKEIKISKDPYQARVFGFIGERLLNVYCFHHSYKIMYSPILFITPENSYPKIAYLFKDIINNIRFHLKSKR